MSLDGIYIPLQNKGTSLFGKVRYYYIHVSLFISLSVFICYHGNSGLSINHISLSLSLSLLAVCISLGDHCCNGYPILLAASSQF